MDGTVSPPTSLTNGTRPLLSYPDSDIGAAVVTSTPEIHAQCLAWDIREHDYEVWLDAKHEDTPEDFWTSEYIERNGRDFCDLVLRYIIKLNAEEVVGTAHMFVDQIIMQSPASFSSMMEKPLRVKEIFSMKLAKYYGRRFLEKVLESCRYMYEVNPEWYDQFRYVPPTDPSLRALAMDVLSFHNPQNLKQLGIMPFERPDEWPVTYFNRARGKLPPPTEELVSAIMLKPIEADDDSDSTLSGDHAQENDPASGGDSALIEVKKSASGSGINATAASTGTTSTQVDQSHLQNNAPEEAEIPSTVDNVRSIDEAQSSCIATGGDEHIEKTEVSPTMPMERTRRKSESDSPSEYLQFKGSRNIVDIAEAKRVPESLRASEWMAAPGAERRAVSTQSQAQFVADSHSKPKMKAFKPSYLPNGRGGALRAGQFVYKPGATPPTFTHSIHPEHYKFNNAVYLYHQDVNFGRGPPMPDHATTYRTGTPMYRTDPHTRDMFVPLPMEAMGSHPGVPPVLHQSLNVPGGPPLPFVPRNTQHSTPFPPNQGPGYSGQGFQHTYPFGRLTKNMAHPYVKAVGDGVRPTPEQFASMPPHNYPRGFIPMGGIADQHLPSISETTNQFGTHRPEGLGSVRPSSAMGANMLVNPDHHQGVTIAGPSTSSHNGMRGNRHSQGGNFSSSLNPRRTEFSPASMRGGPMPMTPQQSHLRLENQGTPTYAGHRRSHVAHSNGKPGMHPSSGGIVPFPSYHEEQADLPLLPEGEQCTSLQIGPDAEDVVTLWFGNIATDSTAHDLKVFLEQTMPIVHVRDPVYDPHKSAGMGWTFVRFLSNKDARVALSCFQNCEFRGINLKVQVPDKRCGDRARTGSSFSHTNQIAYNYNSDAPHQANSNAGGTPSRYYGVGASGHRGSRSSSMSQAIRAVRRNSVYTQSDVRGELDLNAPPPVMQGAQPAFQGGALSFNGAYSSFQAPPPPFQGTLPPTFSSQAGLAYVTEQDEATSQSSHVPSKKKFKSKKKKKDFGRDSSATPSESARPSTSASKHAKESSDDTVIHHNPKKHVNKSNRQKKRAQEQEQPQWDDNIATDAETSKHNKAMPIAEDDEHPKVVDEAIAFDGEVDVDEIETAPDGVASAKPNIDDEGVAGSVGEEKPQETQPSSQDEEVMSSKPLDTLDAVQLPTNEAVVDDEKAVADRTGTDHAISASSIANAAETKDDNIDETASKQTIWPECKAGAASLDAGTVIPKAKGAPQTESLSIFASKKPVKQKEPGKKAQKKARQAATRKASKTQYSTSNMQAEYPNEDNTNTIVKETEPKSQTADVVESSSLVATPETAREYLSPGPATPTRKSESLVVKKKKGGKKQKEQIAQDGEMQQVDGQTDKPQDTTTTAESSTPKAGRRASMFEGMLKSTEEKLFGTDQMTGDSSSQDSSRQAHQSDSFETSSSLPKKENNKTTMTYAQVAKRTKGPAAPSGGTGLSERDINAGT